MPIDGNCKQQMPVPVPCTDVSAYSPGSYFMMNFPRSGLDFLFDGPNFFLRFMVTNKDAATLNFDHSCHCFFTKS